MSQVSRTASKAKFETGDTPSQSDFGDLHDSVLWYDEAPTLSSANAFTNNQTITKTTEQLRLAYDGSNSVPFTVNSGGDLIIAPTGGDVNVTGSLSATNLKFSSTLEFTGGPMYLATTGLYWSIANNGTFKPTANGATITRNIADGNTALVVNQIHASSTGKILDLQFGGASKASVDKDGNTVAAKYSLSALNTAPSSASDTGTTGEIRVTADYIYVCTATNTWKRTAISTW
jgi:hypothetical protein